MSKPANQSVELRGCYDHDLVAALDMIAMAKRMTRSDLVGRVLRMYVAQKQHEASMVAKTARINPAAVDSQWNTPE
jgi:metal-responsive CopG/Arc/MetJ family transcriptional regulator